MNSPLRTKEFFFSNETPWESLDEKLQRQIMGYDEHIMLVKVAFKTGGVGQMHQHPHSQVTYVESGAFEMTIGDQKHIIRQGDSYYVPPHVMHGCTCVEDGMLIDVFSPHREDFLQD